MTTIFKPQTILPFVLLLLISALYYYFNRSLAKDGVDKAKLRKIPAIDAIDEAIGRSTEMGRPVQWVVPGSVDVTAGVSAVPAALSALTILRYVATVCARQDVPLLAHPTYKASTIPIITSILTDVYTAEGKIDQLDLNWTLRWGSGDYRTMEYFVGSTAERENAGCQIMIGATGPALALVAPEGAARAGALLVDGAINISSLQYLAVSCDYCVMGEEIFATGAYLGRELAAVSSLLTVDYTKYVVLFILAIGAIFTAAGASTIFNSILKT
jgi:hypothetical protein